MFGFAEGVQVPFTFPYIKIKNSQKVNPLFWCREWDLMGSAHHSLRKYTIMMNLHSLEPDGNKTWVISRKPSRIKGSRLFIF